MRSIDDTFWNHLVRQWTWTAECLRRKNAHVNTIAIAPPIPETQVGEFERFTGLRLPTDVVELLTRYSGGFSFHWTLRDPNPSVKRTFDPPIRNLRRGGNSEVPFIGASSDRSLLSLYRDWQEELDQTCAMDDPDTHEALRAMFPLYSAEGGGGDYTALRLDVTPAQVVYLDHEDCYASEGNTVLSRSGLGEFLWRWSSLGFPERSALSIFIPSGSQEIDYESPQARAWIQWLGGDHK